MPASLSSLSGLCKMSEKEGDYSSTERYAEVEDWIEMLRWLREKTHQGRPVSRLRMEGGLLIVQDDKIVFDFKDGRHRTIYADRKRGILGTHLTREGSRNIHEDVVELDVSRLRKEDDDNMHRLSWRKIQVGDDHLADLLIEVAKEQFESLDLYHVHGKEAVINSEAARKLEANMERLTIEEFNKRNVALGPVFNRNWGIVFRQDSPAGLLFWDPKGLFYLDFELYSKLKQAQMKSVPILRRPGRETEGSLTATPFS